MKQKTRMDRSEIKYSEKIERSIVQTTIEEGELSWLGHIMRRQDNRWIETIE